MRVVTAYRVDKPPMMKLEELQTRALSGPPIKTITFLQWEEMKRGYWYPPEWETHDQAKS